MWMPGIFGEDLFDEFFDDAMFRNQNRAMKEMEKKMPGPRENRLMKTDIREMKDGYELMIELPGYKKDEVRAALENGCLTITAQKTQDTGDQEQESGRYIRRERYTGACKRSFYVGERLTQEDIKASFQDGILTLKIPKEEAKQVKESRYISIEG